MEQYGIALFYNTRDAMAAEKAAKEQALRARIIGTPGKIKATCGFCLKYDVAEEGPLRDLIRRGQWRTEGFFHVVQDGLAFTYEPVKEET